AGLHEVLVPVEAADLRSAGQRLQFLCGALDAVVVDVADGADGGAVDLIEVAEVERAHATQADDAEANFVHDVHPCPEFRGRSAKPQAALAGFDRVGWGADNSPP